MVVAMIANTMALVERGWIDEPVLRGRLIHALNMEGYKAFAREGIEIPYSKLDVHVVSMPSG